MGPGFHQEPDKPVGLGAALAHPALAAAGLSALDCFEFDCLYGCSPREAMLRLLQSFPEDAPDTVEERIDITVELIETDRVDPGVAAEILTVFGIHPLSLFGARMGDKRSLKTMGFKQLLGLPPDAIGEALYIRPAGGFSLSGFRELEQLPPGLKINYLHLTSLPRLQGIGEGLSIFRGLRIQGCLALQRLPPLVHPGLSLRVEDCHAFSGFQGEISASDIHLRALPSLSELTLASGCASPSIIIRECAGLRRVSFSSDGVMELDLFQSGVPQRFCHQPQID